MDDPISSLLELGMPAMGSTEGKILEIDTVSQNRQNTTKKLLN